MAVTVTPRATGRTTRRNPTDSTAPTPAVPLGTIASTLGISVAAARERFALLTKRERQVALLMAADQPNESIAEQLGISTSTLVIHRTHVQLKLQARTGAAIANVVHLAMLAGATD